MRRQAFVDLEDVGGRAAGIDGAVEGGGGEIEVGGEIVRRYPGACAAASEEGGEAVKNVGRVRGEIRGRGRWDWRELNQWVHRRREGTTNQMGELQDLLH